MCAQLIQQAIKHDIFQYYDNQGQAKGRFSESRRDSGREKLEGAPGGKTKSPHQSCHGLPGSSAGKESICSAGDPGFTPGSGRSTGEGIGCPLQYPLASLVAQMVKNLPTVQETPGWFPGSGRCPGEGISYPLQDSRASPLAQMVNILLAMQETWVPSLGWEDALKESMATHSNSCLENPHIQRSLEGYSPWGSKDLDMTERLSTILPFPDLPQGQGSPSPSLRKVTAS